MPVFAYTSIDVNANEVCGTITADTPWQARDILRDRCLTIQTLKAVATSDKLRFFQKIFRKRNPVVITSFFRELSTLLGVGIPLLEALDTLIKQSRGSFETTLKLIRDGVAGGSSLADTMKKQPQIFDEFCICITEVGEVAGNLDTALNELAEFRETSDRLRGNISTALLYPTVVTITGLCVTLFLMTYVVPSLIEGLVESGRPLPWPTKIVKNGSDFLLAYPLPIAGCVLGFVFSILSILKNPKGQYVWHKFQLKIPIFGDMIKKQAIAKIAIIISTLMKSGLTFMHSIQIAGNATQNRPIKDSLKVCENAVHAGQDIAFALERTNMFPPLVVQIFAVGQHSGQLEVMLDRLANDYNRQVQTIAKRFTTVLEPVLIILLAVFVGFITFATILPLLEAGNVF